MGSNDNSQGKHRANLLCLDFQLIIFMRHIKLSSMSCCY